MKLMSKNMTRSEQDKHKDRRLVTAILPTYNRPNRLKRAIKSVVGQKYRPIELIVIDDASDSFYAQNIVSKLTDSSICTRIIRHEKNKGASAARNTGINQAKGKYVAFLDDDDEWLPEKTAKQIKDLESSKGSISYTWVRRLDSNHNQRALYTPKNSGDITERLLKQNVTGTTSTVIAETDLCRSMGGFDESFPRWNDWDFSLRASQRTKFTLIQEPLVNQYTWDGNQLSDNFEKLKTARDRLLSKHIHLATKFGMESQFRSWTNFGVGIDAGMAGKYKLGRRCLFCSIRHCPTEPRFYIYLMIFSGGKYTLSTAQHIKRSVSRLISSF
jgi:glycosyltransferase involved in cell wall biosynthesis